MREMDSSGYIYLLEPGGEDDYQTIVAVLNDTNFTIQSLPLITKK